LHYNKLFVDLNCCSIVIQLFVQQKNHLNSQNMKNHSYLNDLDIVHLTHAQAEAANLSLHYGHMKMGLIQTALHSHHAAMAKLAATVQLGHHEAKAMVEKVKLLVSAKSKNDNLSLEEQKAAKYQECAEAARSVIRQHVKMKTLAEAIILKHAQMAQLQKAIHAHHAQVASAIKAAICRRAILAAQQS
jgi:hypothetical protein